VRTAAVAGSRAPPPRPEVSHRRPDDAHAFGPQQRAFELQVAAVAAEATARGDHAMAGHVAGGTAPHVVADGTRCERATGKRRHIAICCHASQWNAAHDSEHAAGESGFHSGVV
jgi:hypothetical protein